MPKIQWTNLPPTLRDHLFGRLRDRKITAKNIGEMLGEMSYTVTAGAGFTLTSTSGTDTSVYDWFLVEGP